jgi:hypothetical protein
MAEPRESDAGDVSVHDSRAEGDGVWVQAREHETYWFYVARDPHRRRFVTFRRMIP